MNKILNLYIPNGTFSSTEDAAKRKRKELANKLRRGEEIKVGKDGNVTNSEHSSSKLHIPHGKLASFYWYDNDPGLLKEEKEAMREHFPDFNFLKLPDNRFAWRGKVNPGIIERDWHLLVAYEHNHPHNTSFGGSIKIYSENPDLKIMQDIIGYIPHLLTDSESVPYLCTAEHDDFKAGEEGEYVTSAASTIAWAIKWIAVFELWLEDEISTTEFTGHTF